ncbi:MAG: gliding motility protein GldN [Bacteroidia bacterium]|jgi:gliding motility associated protien GldN|nr:gliding motility protein GldN [Bacteroidia bacterium]
MRWLMFIACCLLANILVAQQPVSSTPLREADVLLSKRIWRVVDLRERQNSRATWPGNPLVSILYNNAKAGVLKAYTSDSLSKTYPIESFINRGVEIEYIETPIDPNDPGLTKMDTIYNPFEPTERIKQLLLLEEHIFDAKHGTSVIRIIAIAPLFRYQVAGIDLGMQPLCWLKFEDPKTLETDCRDILVKQKMFNPQNSRSTFTYDDWFIQRQFTGFIIKESNMHDVSILQDPYVRKNGLLALIIAEQQKQESYQKNADLFEE